MTPEDIPDEFRRCPSGKRKYDSVKEAKEQNKSRNRIRQSCANGHNSKVYYYLCPLCDWYHTTTQSPREHRRKRRNA